MNVLVTGGCGYIGSALVPMLQADDAVDGVTILDTLSSGSPRALLGTLSPAEGDEDGASDADDSRAAVDFRRGDVREYGDVENAMREVDTVMHLAAITGAASTHDRRDETFDVNYEGTENVVRAD